MTGSKLTRVFLFPTVPTPPACPRRLLKIMSPPWFFTILHLFPETTAVGVCTVGDDMHLIYYCN
jgi:hypothetical protein